MIDDGVKGGVELLEPQARPAAATSPECEGRREEMSQAATKRAEELEVTLVELQDSELVARFLEGYGLAFPELVRRYQSRLLNFIYRTIGDRDRAEDLVQETFIRVYRHLHRFDQTKKFSTWIYTIASNLAKNELRNRSRNPLVLFQTIKKNWEADHRPLQWEDPHYRPDDLFRKRHLRDIVEKAVEQLPEHHRSVFVLREMEGKTYEEISEITGVNLGTVKSRLNRARNNFAQIIAPMLR
ncbi:MAG: sigma-70 family RNA polymerase sigma factor [Gemmatimonadota bacterium]|nr:MAG: sigma-70 family RNA polymerase sigma factor [Gemmatimonadota bacterium]